MIPTFNHGDYIRRAILSALDCQSSTLNVDVVVVDDGSEDDTEAIISECISIGQPVIYLKQKNSGPAVARNRGSSESNADFFIFLDADDELQSRAVQSAVALISEEPTAEILIAGHNSISKFRKKYVSPGDVNDNKEVNLKRYLIKKKIKMCNGSVLIRRGAAKLYRYPESIYGAEDIPFFAHLLANCVALRFDFPMVDVNKHAASFRHCHEYKTNSISDRLEVMFNSEEMPPWSFNYKNRCKGLLYLSKFRSLYHAGNYHRARASYLEAINVSFISMFRFAYLRKYILSFFKRESSAPKN
ncbi:MAG: glycosyltransferase [Porticoccaceae bacterium]